MEITFDSLRELFDNPQPPERVWEQQFDGFDRQLRETAKKPWEEITPKDLSYYLEDVAFARLQKELFDYLFPVCLHFWYRTLMEDDFADPGGLNDVHSCIRHGNILSKMLDETGREKVYRVIHDGFLHRLDVEKALPPREDYPVFEWIYRFNSIGIVFPIIDRVWNSWWSLETRGRALCVLHWVAGLIYDDYEHPLFLNMHLPAFVEGGQFDRPYLRENDGFVGDMPWLETNIAFLHQTLSPNYFHHKLQDAAQVLAGGEEQRIALEMAAMVQERTKTVQRRLDWLLNILEHPPENSVV